MCWVPFLARLKFSPQLNVCALTILASMITALKIMPIVCFLIFLFGFYKTHSTDGYLRQIDQTKSNQVSVRQNINRPELVCHWWPLIVMLFVALGTTVLIPCSLYSWPLWFLPNLILNLYSSLSFKPFKVTNVIAWLHEKLFRRSSSLSFDSILRST